jgi:hypothetical protein
MSMRTLQAHSLLVDRSTSLGFRVQAHSLLVDRSTSLGFRVQARSLLVDRSTSLGFRVQAHSLLVDRSTISSGSNRLPLDAHHGGEKSRKFTIRFLGLPIFHTCVLSNIMEQSRFPRLETHRLFFACIPKFTGCARRARAARSCSA